MCEQTTKKILFEQGFYLDGGVLKNAGMCPNEFAETFVFVELRVYDFNYRILTSIHRRTTSEGMHSEKELLSSHFNDADAIRFAIAKLDAMKVRLADRLANEGEI
jgi:hypothetical protein